MGDRTRRSPAPHTVRPDIGAVAAGPTDQPLGIEQVRTFQLSLPNAHGREVTTSKHSISTAECVLVEIEADGLTGVGYSMTFREGQTSAIRAVIHDLFDGVSSRLAPRPFWERMLNQLDYSGRAGIGLSAVSAIDTALWDLRAQRRALPLYEYLGSRRVEMPLYVTGGFISSDVGELASEALGYLADGFGRFKMKVGHPAGWREDVRRVQVVRGAVRDLMEIYVDANQAWSIPDAVSAGRALFEHGVTWLEDPIASGDLDAMAALSKAVDIPLVTGELAYLSDGFRLLIQHRCADILMPDIMRCGGPTGLLEVADLADASGIPIVSHAFTEICAQVMSACPNTKVLEYFPGWFEKLYKEPPVVHDGSIYLGLAPGLGLSFAEDAKRRYGLDTGALAFSSRWA